MDPGVVFNNLALCLIGSPPCFKRLPSWHKDRIHDLTDAGFRDESRLLQVEFEMFTVCSLISSFHRTDYALHTVSHLSPLLDRVTFPVVGLTELTYPCDHLLSPSASMLPPCRLRCSVSFPRAMLWLFLPRSAFGRRSLTSFIANMVAMLIPPAGCLPHLDICGRVQPYQG